MPSQTTEKIIVFDETTVQTVADSSDKDASIENTSVTVPTKISDLRTATSSLEYYQNKFPDFYFCITSKGWYCKTCSNFAQVVSGNVPFINSPGTFGDHPTRRANKHLTSERHSESAKNKQAFKEMSNRRTNVWKMLKEASYAQEIKKTATNRFVIKCFFRITHLLINQKWAHTSNFKNIVKLVADCGGEEVKTHILNAPKNAMYCLLFMFQNTSM